MVKVAGTDRFLPFSPLGLGFARYAPAAWIKRIQGRNPLGSCVWPMSPLTTASISLELLHDCLGTLEQLITGITSLGVEATHDPTHAPRVRFSLAELLISLQQFENDLRTYPPSP